MSVMIKSFQKEDISVSVLKVTVADALIKDSAGNHCAGYMVTANDSNEERLRLLSITKFDHKPARWQVEKCFQKAKQARIKMDSQDGVSSTLNLLQEMGFKPLGISEYL